MIISLPLENLFIKIWKSTARSYVSKIFPKLCLKIIFGLFGKNIESLVTDFGYFEY